MAKLQSQAAAGGSKDIKTGRTARLLPALISAVLVNVAVAADDRPPSSDSDAQYASQEGRAALLLHDSEAGQQSPPPAAGSTYESEEDCE